VPESTLRSVLDPSVADLLALFAGPLAGVRFPDIDHETLRDLAGSVERGHAEVEEARAMLTAAETALELRVNELLLRAQRARAYARVYAEGKTELQAQLDGIALPKPGPRPAPGPLTSPGAEPRRRGRPRKARDGAQLFGVDVAEVPAAE
jgi:hypothetical protein